MAQKTQYAVGPNGTALFDKDNKQYVQQVTGTLLYYAKAVDSTMLVALSAWHPNRQAQQKRRWKK